MARDKMELEDPPSGWVWREAGPRGPGWYPPLTEGDVDTTAEHLVLAARAAPDEVLARVGAGADDAMFVAWVERSEAVVEAVERLFFTCFDEIGTPPTFEKGYEHCESTVNQSYADPFWSYREAE